MSVHAWVQLDYREIVDDPTLMCWPPGARRVFVDATPPVRIVAARVVEWCSACGALRRLTLRGRDGAILMRKVVIPRGTVSCRLTKRRM